VRNLSSLREKMRSLEKQIKQLTEPQKKNDH